MPAARVAHTCASVSIYETARLKYFDRKHTSRSALIIERIAQPPAVPGGYVDGAGVDPHAVGAADLTIRSTPPPPLPLR
jgi:hypothetical protein